MARERDAEVVEAVLLSGMVAGAEVARGGDARGRATPELGLSLEVGSELIPQARAGFRVALLRQARRKNRRQETERCR